MTKMNRLFENYQFGDLQLPNRIVMAPMTRNRAGQENAPTDMNARYYKQRSSAGLIVTEATQVSPKGQGYPSTPGIHSEEQIEGWKKVTEAVHDAGGRIFLQLWHVGRISHSDYHDGELPIAPSTVKPEGTVLKPDFEEAEFETPRSLVTDEIPEIVGQYRRGARNAKQADFDGVEIHAANGYLIDQFLRSGTNQRSDRYGGSPEKRVRFLTEVIDAVSEVWEPDRVGVRYSPLSEFNDMQDEDPEETFRLASAVADRNNLNYVHLVEPDQPKPPTDGDGQVQSVFSAIRDAFDGTLIANNNYDEASASRALETSYADLVAFGRAFLANPDLPRRIKEGRPLNVPDPETFYGGDEQGYTDYPTLEELDVRDDAIKTLDSLSELDPR